MALTTVDFYNYTGDPAVANKNLGTVVGSTATLKPLENISNLDIRIVIDFKENFMGCNYIGCDGAYYKITDRQRAPAGAMMITARIDGVKSYWEQIKLCPCLASRSASRYTLYIPDNKIKLKSYTKQQTLTDDYKRGIFAYNAHFILITVG